MIGALFPKQWANRAALTASLSLNIFLVAFLATQYLGSRVPMLTKQAYRARETQIVSAQAE